jgi:hypothetical protein
MWSTGDLRLASSACVAETSNRSFGAMENVSLCSTRTPNKSVNRTAKKLRFLPSADHAR